jgi:Nitroreductase family
MTTRRTFLRIAGTSAVIVAAGGIGLNRCDPMPDAAVEAWRGPAPDVKDPRVRALSFALLAPNPHNMQPWIANLSEPGVVTFHCDRTRLLPATDPYSRQITIGCGAFLELLRMAAAEQGFRADITLFPAGAWLDNEVGDAPLVRVAFVPDANVTRDQLFAQVLKRRTNRAAYETQAIAAEQGDAIGTTMTHLPVRYGWTQASDAMTRLKAIAREAWRVEMATDPTYYESVKVYRITGDEIAKHRDGVSFHGPLFWWLNAVGLFTREGGLQGDKFMRDQTMTLIDGQLAGTPAFAWIATEANDRRAQLDAGAAYVRANLKAVELGLAVQPLSQALQEYKEMTAHYVEIKQALGFPEMDTVQMFFRLGRAALGEPVPRRRLDDIITT